MDLRSFLLPMVVALGGAARADTPTPSIDETQLLARVANDPQLARIAAELDLARADVVAAGVRPNPTISFEREEVFPDGGLATDYLRLELPLEISGRRALHVASARASAAAVASESERARFAVTVAALRAFRIAAYERLRVDLLRAERAALVKAVEVVRKRSTAGASSGYDLQRIELELLAYDDLSASAETQLATARVELGAVAGLAGGVDANDPLPLPNDPADVATLASTVESHPDFRAATLRVDGARSLSRAASRAWVPELTLAGGIISQDLGTETARGYTAGLFVAIPLFEHGQVDRARGAAQARVARADREVLARDISAAIRAAHLTFTRTLARARGIEEKQIARLDQLLRSAETAYREGGGNVVELVDAYRTARDTRLRDLELRRDARLAELELWLALGRRP
jgi:outer membrane protein, heavy metal efflux system